MNNNNSDFSIHNIPFGIFSIKNGQKRLATIIVSWASEFDIYFGY